MSGSASIVCYIIYTDVAEWVLNECVQVETEGEDHTDDDHVESDRGQLIISHCMHN